MFLSVLWTIAYIILTGNSLAIFLIAVIVRIIALEQHNAAGFAVAKKRDRVVGGFLQIAEADDIAVGLDGVQNPVRPGKRLNETVHFKILVHPERIERRCVKACQEHIDHDEQINLPRLDALGQVFVVILELVRRCVKIDMERLVIVLNGGVQKIARSLVQCVRLKAFLRQCVFGIVFIRSKAEDRRNGQIAVLLGKLALELCVVFHRHRDGADGKDGVEARHALTLEGIKAVAFRFLVKMLQRVADDLANALRRAHRLFNVDRPNLRVFHVVLFLDRVHIVDAKRQDVPVIDRIHDRVGVELVAKRLLRGSKVRVFARPGVDGEDRRAGEAEQVIVLKGFRDRLVHISELAAVTFVENDDKMLPERRVAFVFAHKNIKLLDRRDDDPRVGVFHLPLQNGGACVTVRRTLFKAVVFLHRLIIQILAVYDEQHLVDIRQLRRQLRGLERRERLAASRRVPDVAARFRAAILLVGCGDFDAIENSLRRRDLIRAHDEQQVF